MRRIVIALILLNGTALFPQKIPPTFFSLNAWMPDTLGDPQNCHGKIKGVPCHLNGKLHSNNTWKLVAQSGARLIRFGGEHADENKPTLKQYIQVIDSARAHGMEPLLQVPYNNNYYTADTAAALVRYINVTMRRKVLYWSIGNEPDISPPYGYGYLTASPIADYIRQFATKMKAEDSTIITLGPELKYYNDDHSLISELTTPGGFYDITGKVPGHTYHYIDLITFHYYPFAGQQVREEVITNLRHGQKFSHFLEKLQKRIDTCNLYHERQNNLLKMAITEAHINYRNSSDHSVNAQSFLAGQFWCEMLGVGLEKGLEFISFWSIIESSLGYIDDYNQHLRPTYHHFKLMASHFKGFYCKSDMPADIQDLKVIAWEDDNYISVLLLNQKANRKTYRYSLYFGRNKSADGRGIRVKIHTRNMYYENVIFSDTISDESTELLVFTQSGVLVKKYRYYNYDPAGAPVLVSDHGMPVLVNIQPEITADQDKEVVLFAGTRYKDANYKWYEFNSDTPLNDLSSPTLKVIAKKNTQYRLVVSYNDCVMEGCVKVKVRNQISSN
jgi:hypothetical protein